MVGLTALPAWADESIFDAVKAGDKAKVELLIAKGADVKAKNNKGKTPLQVAKDKDVIAVLTAHGAHM